MKNVLLAVLVAVGAGCGATRGLVYYPSHSADQAPEGVEDVVFFSADGTTLHGWLERFPGATRAVLACHGNAGDVTGREGELHALVKATRASVFEFDYRGYGSSGGEPREDGIAADAQAALLELERATSVPAGRTIVLGHSLGGAVAIDLAYRKPAVGGLVTLSTFTSLDDLVADLLIPGLGWICPESWDSSSKVGAISKPKLFVHGTADQLIPLAHGKTLFERAAEPKQLLVVDGADHNFIIFAPGVLDAIGRFVDSVAPIGTTSETTSGKRASSAPPTGAR